MAMVFSIRALEQFKPQQDGRDVDGEIHCDIKQLDMSKVEYFEKKYLDLLKKLDSWVLFPDGKLVNDISKLGKIVDDVYKINDILIYRGFGTGSLSRGHQETMGLAEKAWLGGTKLKQGVVPGYKFVYTAVRPTSFTWDERIARVFGNVVVQGISKKGSPRLVITNELSYLVGKLRNLNQSKEFGTQREVIVLPPSKLACTVNRV